MQGREYFPDAGVGLPPEPYSQAVRVGDTVYIAGQVALDADWKVVGAGDPLMQAEQVWRNLSRVAESAGSAASQIVKITVFLADVRHASAEMTARARYFPEGMYPICTQVQVANLGLPELLMEVDAIAIIEKA